MTSPAQAVADIQPTDDALALGRALASDVGWIAGAGFESHAGLSAAALLSGGAAGFPTGGATAVVLSTGDATLITAPNSEPNSGANLGGPSLRGNTDFDVTVLRVDLQVPQTANCLVGIDFRFLSEEYPEFVGSGYNDAFIAEVDHTTWTTSGSEVAAPNNFAFDPAGNPISINAAGVTSMTAADAAGTTFDGATPALTAATPLTPGPHRLYLSIFDQGDPFLDSVVLIDNLRLGHVNNVATDCRPGAQPVDRSRYVGLGDSYSSGFGVSPYFDGTHQDGTVNDCQRSKAAFAPLVASERNLNRDFHACQGAVTRDFYLERNSTWGEAPQLDHLNDQTGLVTFSIGGNDAKFVQVLAECILGFELLPFNTCYNDEKVKRPVREAFARLDNTAASPASIVPYNTLYRDVRRRAPIATAVAVGYPHFFTSQGSDRTFLPGGRCEGVKKADQRWIVEKIDELNKIIDRNARRNGFLFANPNPRFDGHELCSGGAEWFFPVSSAGRLHPTGPGQRAIADAVLNQLDTSGFERFTVLPGQTAYYTFVVGGPKPFFSVVTGWPGSDVSLALRSPSGRLINRSTIGADIDRETGPTWEHLEVSTPELGTWTVEMTGEDVSPAGEPVTLSIYQADAPNVAPVGQISTRVEGGQLVLDATGSSDSDGQVVAHDWYIATASDDVVLQGPQVRVPLNGPPERTITLVITDDRGATDFVELRWLPIDIMPGSVVNPIQLKSTGLTPVAVMSTATFDATALQPMSIRMGTGEAAPKETSIGLEDVNGDGRTDVVLHFLTSALKLTKEMTQLCLRGNLPDGETFSSCDRIRTQ